MARRIALYVVYACLVAGLVVAIVLAFNTKQSKPGSNQTTGKPQPATQSPQPNPQQVLGGGGTNSSPKKPSTQNQPAPTSQPPHTAPRTAPQPTAPSTGQPLTNTG